jgi:hypothetical protein
MPTFTDLPGEIRNAIYELLLPDDLVKINLSATLRDDASDLDPLLKNILPLMEGRSSVRHEVLSMLYSRADFHLKWKPATEPVERVKKKWQAPVQMIRRKGRKGRKNPVEKKKPAEIFATAERKPADDISTEEPEPPPARTWETSEALKAKAWLIALGAPVAAHIGSLKFVQYWIPGRYELPEDYKLSLVSGARFRKMVKHGGPEGERIGLGRRLGNHEPREQIYEHWRVLCDGMRIMGFKIHVFCFWSGTSWSGLGFVHAREDEDLGPVVADSTYFLGPEKVAVADDDSAVSAGRPFQSDSILNPDFQFEFEDLTDEISSLALSLY